MKIQIVPFEEKFLGMAAALLSQPRRLELVSEEILRDTWREPLTNGVALFDGERLAGFLLGQRKIDAQRGRHVWMHLAGHTLATDVDVDLYRDLYAVIGQSWIEQGFFQHIIQLHAFERSAIDAWLGAGFAYEQIHGIRSLSEMPELPEAAVGLEIRRAGPGDGALLAELSGIIRRYQAGAPVWGAALPEHEQEIRQGYAELADDPANFVWLAFWDEQAVGFQAYLPLDEAEQWIYPPNCLCLEVAGTLPQARGLGVGRALTQRGLSFAREAGYEWCATDWRATNLLSSRFWPQVGFHPLMVRMTRRVDERVLWAK